MEHSARLPPLAPSVAPAPAARPLAWTPLREQRVALAWAAALVFPALLMVTALAAITAVKGIDFGLVASDPITVGDLPFYAGIISNLGILLWCAAAAVSLFTGALLLRQPAQRGMAGFLIASGVFTAVLLVDDFFLIHEIVFPYYLGLSQLVPIGAYGAGALAWLVCFRRTIARTDYAVLLVVLGALSVSVVVDQLPPVLPMHLVWEDGAKLVGIAAWCAYFTRTSWRALLAAPRQ